MTVILALRRPRQEDHEFEASLIYIVRTVSEKTNKQDWARRLKLLTLATWEAEDRRTTV
jgi:hypothetical protein